MWLCIFVLHRREIYAENVDANDGKTKTLHLPLQWFHMRPICCLSSFHLFYMKVFSARLPSIPDQGYNSVNKWKSKVVWYCRYTFISLQRWDVQWLVCNDSNSCVMYSYNWCWLADWLAEPCTGGVWKTNCQGHSSAFQTHRTVTGLSFTL